MGRQATLVRRGLIGAALAAVALTASAGSAATAQSKGVVFGGTTSQKHPMVIRVDPVKRRVAQLRLVIEGACVVDPAAPVGTPNTFSEGWGYSRIPMKASGAWKVTENGTETFGDGSKWTYTFDYSGRRLGNTMSGTVSGTITETGPTGATTRVCTTGKISFKLAERRVYGDVSARPVPGFLTLNATGTKVAGGRFWWSGACVMGPAAKPDTPTDAFEIESVPAMRIGRGGAFSGDFATDPVVDQARGVSIVYGLRVSGVKGAKVIRGTLIAGFKETDTVTGATVRTCESPSIKFRFQE